MNKTNMKFYVGEPVLGSDYGITGKFITTNTYELSGKKFIMGSGDFWRPCPPSIKTLCERRKNMPYHQCAHCNPSDLLKK